MRESYVGRGDLVPGRSEEIVLVCIIPGMGAVVA